MACCVQQGCERMEGAVQNTQGGSTEGVVLIMRTRMMPMRKMLGLSRQESVRASIHRFCEWRTLFQSSPRLRVRFIPCTLSLFQMNSCCLWYVAPCSALPTAKYDATEGQVSVSCYCMPATNWFSRVSLFWSCFSSGWHCAGGAVENDEGVGIPKLFERAKGRVFVHPSSIIFSVTKYDTGWMVYSDIVETSKVFVRQCSSVPAYALLLFGGIVKVHHEEGKVSVDKWATLTAQPKIGVLVRELKKRLDTLLAVKLELPETEISQNAIISVVLELLRTDGM